MVTKLLNLHPSLCINLTWCLAHKGVVGNKEADFMAGKAVTVVILISTPITVSFCSLISIKEFLKGCTYYWESFKEKLGPYSPLFMALSYPSLKVKSIYKEIMNNQSLCSRFVCIASHHYFCGYYYKYFYISEPVNYPCKTTIIQDVDHLLYYCPHTSPNLILIHWSNSTTPWC